MDKNVQTVLAVAITAILVFAIMQYGIPAWQAQSSSSYATLTVNYTDGTSKTFDSRSQVTGQTIIDSDTGKTVSSINTNLNIIPTFTGTIQSYTVTGSLSSAIRNAQTGVDVYYSGKIDLGLVYPLPTLVSGSPSIISSSTVSASGLQALYSGWSVSNTYTLRDEFYNVKVTITFTDGSQLSQTVASGSISWNFQYQSSNTFSSLSVNFALSYT